MKHLQVAAALFGCILSGAALADDSAAKADQPDNSGQNKFVNQQQPTADDASNAKGDIELAAKVRRALVDDKSLSTYAHNIKVVANAGVVTITGPVKSDAERKQVEKIALDVAGPEHVKTDGIVAKK